MAVIDAFLGLRSQAFKFLTLLHGGIGGVGEPGRRTRNHASDPVVAFRGHVIDRLGRAETVSPDADTLISGGLGKVDPRFPVIRAFVHGLVGGADAFDVVTDDRAAHAVMAPVVHPKHGAALLQDGIAVLLEHPGAVEITANAVLQDHHVYTQLRRGSRVRLAPDAVQTQPIACFDVD